jgi:eukaryotic-like serine/threonine-protein kinase
MYLADFLLDEGDLARAEAEARAAIELLDVTIRTQATAVLARILLRRGAIAEALEHATAARRHLEQKSIFEGEATVRLVHAEALQASGDHAGAREAVTAANDRLRERAARIDSGFRRKFLEEIPDHARTIALARALIV